MGIGVLLPANKLKNLKKKFHKERERYFDKYNELTNQRDGGNTDLRITTIDESQPGEEISLYEGLDMYSPFLSEKVLKKAANCTEVLSDELIFNLCTHNPEVTKRNEFLHFLKNKQDPFTDEQIENLKLITKPLKTQRGNLEDKISKYHRNMAIYGNEIILYYKHDTDYVDQDSIRAYLQLMDEPMHRMELISSYANTDDYVSMDNQRLSVEEYFDNSDSKYEAMHISCLNFYQRIAPHMMQENTVYNMDESLRAKLVQIANGDKTGSCYRSRNILNWITETNTYKTDFIFPEVQKSNTQIDQTLENNVDQFVLKPNPAKDWVEVTELFPRDNQEGSKTVKLISSNGQLIQTIEWENNQPGKILNTSSLEDGVYFVVLIENGKPVQTEKLIIKK